MRLCMFHPADRPLERGWVGRIEGDRVLHLAAQTLAHFFTGGAGAREHAEYALDGVVLLAPVLHPPSIRLFEADGGFAFANPAAVLGPSASVAAPPGAERLEALPRLAGVVGADGAIGGFTLLLELRAPGLPVPKDRDFALVTGPLVVTPDALLGASLEATLTVAGRVAASGTLAGLDWDAARAHAAAGTHLRTGDLLAGPPLRAVPAEGTLALDAPDVGRLEARVA